jgi:hypothetical protein
MLCRRCRDLFHKLESTKKGTRGEISYYHTASRFSIGSTQGCSLCKVLCPGSYLRRQISKISWRKQTRESYILFVKIHDPSYPRIESIGTYPRQFTRIVSRKGISTIYQTVFTFSDSFTDRLQYGITDQTTFTGSDACFSLARHWIQSCKMRHVLCRQRQVAGRQGWNPTRLVAIEKDGTGSRICEGNMIGKAVDYATLSHCWARKVILQCSSSQRKIRVCSRKLCPIQTFLEPSRMLLCRRESLDYITFG